MSSVPAREFCETGQGGLRVAERSSVAERSRASDDPSVSAETILGQ